MYPYSTLLQKSNQHILTNRNGECDMAGVWCNVVVLMCLVSGVSGGG